MLIIQWLFDKIGYMPKVSVESTWPFPATQKDYIPHEFETKPVRKTAKKPALKKATTRKKKD